MSSDLRKSKELILSEEVCMEKLLVYHNPG